MSDELINLIDEILCGLYTENTNKCVVKYKFGKKKIILVGDLLELAAVSTFAQPITQLYKSLLFKNNFIPFILTKNMRAAKDPKYSEFLSNCRVGVYDFDFIKSRICGEGQPKSEN
jgi:hypothetical protein